MLALVCLLALGGSDASCAEARPNVLLVVADDVGIEMIPSFGSAPDQPVLPNLDALALGGLRFSRAWSNPVCSPTRACVLTGRYAFRHGVGDIVTPTGQALPLSEITLPEALDRARNGYAHAAIGKWHLGNAAVGGSSSPNRAGFAHFAGLVNNPKPSYFQWTKIVNGVPSTSTTYATVDQVDEALAWITDQDGPWFCALNFNAPHDPYHVPPAGTYSEDLTGLDPTVDHRPHYKAALESLDFELGRLLAGLGDGVLDDTMIVFLGDNGTPPEVPLAPYSASKAKGTVYQGGVHVPLIVSGPLVDRPGTTTDRLVHAVDLFATIAAWTGTDLRVVAPGVTIDGQSFADEVAGQAVGALGRVRSDVFAEWFTPNGGPVLDFARALRDERYKLLEFPDREELYDLEADPFEAEDLLLEPLEPAAQAAYDRLRRALTRLVGT